MGNISTGSATIAAPSVDAHTHLAPRLEAGELAPLGLVASGDRYALSGEAPGEPAGAPLGPPPLYDPALLGEHLDRRGIDEALVSIPPPFFRQGLGEQETERWIDAIGRGIVRACADDSRLRPLFYLPLDRPAVAASAVRAHMGSDDIAGWAAGAGGDSVALDDPSLAELWSLLSADGRPLLLHPAESPDERLRPHYLHNLLGNPVETAVAVGQLLFGGVLDAHPQLKLVLVHCGGVVPAVASRWQRGIDTARPGVAAGLRPVAEQLRGLYADCLAHDPANLDLARGVFGDDRLLLGSDWPFPMGLDDPREAIAHLPDELQERIARENPRRLGSLAPHG